MSNWMGKSRMIGIVALCLLLVLPATVSAISVTGSKYMGSIEPGGTDTHTMTVTIGSDENPTTFWWKYTVLARIWIRVIRP